MSFFLRSLRSRFLSSYRRFLVGFGRTKSSFRVTAAREGDLNRRLLVRLAPRKLPTTRQLRYAGTVLSPVERKITAVLSAAALVSLFIIVVRIITANLAAVPARGGEYTEGLVGAPNYINPLYAPGNDVDADLVRIIYSGLFRTLPDGKLDVDLAESFEISDDGKVTTVRLRDNLRWHDGKPLSIDDILFTFEAAKNPEWKSPLLPVFRGVGIEKVDDRTVRFTLEGPYAPFLRSLTLGILPSHLWGDVSPASATLAEFNQKPVGSGPFRMKSFLRDRVGQIHSYTLEANPYFHRQRPFLDRMVFRFYPDSTLLTQALLSRQVDGAAFLPQSERRRLSVRRDLQTLSLRLPQETAVFFNLKNDLFKNPEVRKALSVSADRQRILREALNGEGEIIDGPVLPGLFPGLENPPSLQYDPALAIKALEEAGFSLPEGSSVRIKVTKDKKGKVTATSTLSFALTTVDRNENVAAVKILEENWRAVGAEVRLNVVDTSGIQKDIIRPRNFDALLFGEVLGADPDPYPFWHSSQGGERGLNLSGFANRTADELLEAARKTADPAERAKKYNEFQKLVAAEAPALFLFRPFYPYSVHKKVMGIDIGHTSVPSDRFAGVTEWYIKTRPTLKK